MKRTTASLLTLASFISVWVADRARALAAVSPTWRLTRRALTSLTAVTAAVALTGGLVAAFTYAVPAAHRATAEVVLTMPGPPPGPAEGQVRASVQAGAARQAVTVIQVSASASASASAAASHRAAVLVAQHAAAVASAAAQAQAQAAAAQAPAPVVTPAPTQAAAPPSAGVYSYTGLEQLWLAAGGPSWAEAHAASIATCESGGRVNAFNPSGASGLWQILGQVVAGYIFDPMVNALNAVAKFTASGDTFAQWVCQ
jgi:hypothetical protein